MGCSSRPLLPQLQKRADSGCSLLLTYGMVRPSSPHDPAATDAAYRATVTSVRSMRIAATSTLRPGRSSESHSVSTCSLHPMKKDPAGTATISAKVSSAGFVSGGAIGGSSAGAGITVLPLRIDRTMTGIALASAINKAEMPAMGRNLRDARTTFGGLGEGRSDTSGPDVHCTFTSVRF